jgi:hypothetical protein
MRYGQLIIASLAYRTGYLLSKKEGRTGSPEKPLSGLGALSYRNYWKLAVFRYLDTAIEPVTFEAISKATSMTSEDVLTTLVTNDMITIRDEPADLMAKKKRAQQQQREQGGVAGQAVSRTQQTGGSGPIVMPDDYTIHVHHPSISDYLSRQASKGYLQLRPERLKYTPFLVQRLTLIKSGMIESHTVAKAQAVEVQGELPNLEGAGGTMFKEQRPPAEVSSPDPLAEADQVLRTAIPAVLQENGAQSSDGLPMRTDGPTKASSALDPALLTSAPTSINGGKGSALTHIAETRIPRTPSRKGHKDLFSPSDISEIGNSSPGRRSLRSRVADFSTPVPLLQSDLARRSMRSGSRADLP